MKICHIFCHPGNGGAEKYALYLSRAAIESGNEVFFILGGSGPLEEALKSRNINYEISSMPSFYNLIAIKKVKEILEKQNIDIAHTHFMREQFIVSAAKKMGLSIKLIRTFHRLNRYERWVWPLYKTYSPLCEAYIAVSDYAKKYMNNIGIKKNITVIHNGTPAIQIKEHDVGVGFLGRIHKEKGIVDLAKRWPKNVPNLIIAGDGPESEKIKSIKQENIKYLGFVEDLEYFFKKINVLVLPTSIESTLPLVVLEAYSAGIPVIAFNDPAYNDLFFNDRDLFEKNDYDSLIQRAIQIADKKEIDSISLQTYFENNFSIEKMWSKTERVYKKILA